MRRLFLAYAVGLAPALLLAVAQPVWSRVDEAWHADVLAQYSHGVYPVLGVTGIQPEILREMERTGVFRWDSFTSPPPDPALRTFGPPPPDLTPYERGVWVRRHIWEYSYEALQPPLYYLLATPLWWAADAAGGTLAAIYAVRLLNAALVALMAPLTFLLARELFPGRTTLAVGATALAATVPGFVLNASQVTNDAAAAVLGAVCLLLAASGLRRGWSLPRAAWLGAAFGVALLTKPTVIALAPALAYAVLWPRATPGQRLARALASAAAAAVVVAPWLLLNLAIYHSPTTGPAGQALNSATVPWHLGPTFVIVNLLNLFTTFWSGDQLPYTAHWAWPLAVLLVPLSALAGAGLFRLLRDRDGRRAALGLPVLAVLGAVTMSMVLPLASHNDFYSPGRYIYPELPALAVLLSAGLLRELSGRLGQAAVASVAVGATFVILAYAVLGPAPKPGLPTHPPPAAALRALSGQSSRAGLTVSVEEIRVSSGAVWVHVSAVNSSSQLIEWSPMPDVFVEGDPQPLATGIYQLSDPFPEDLTPGQAVKGWIRMSGDRGRLASAGKLRFRFLQVAANGYHDVGDLFVTAAP